MKKSTNTSGSKKSYKKTGIITAAAIAVIGIIYGSYVSVSQMSDWFSSSTFSLDKTSYNIGDKVVLTSTSLSREQRGEVVFMQPDGKIHHTYPFDGSRVNAVKHSFRILPSSSDCIPTDMLGVWKASFRMQLGAQHNPITFEVTPDSDYGEDLKPCTKK